MELSSYNDFEPVLKHTVISMGRDIAKTIFRKILSKKPELFRAKVLATISALEEKYGKDLLGGNMKDFLAKQELVEEYKKWLLPFDEPDLEVIKGEIDFKTLPPAFFNDFKSMLQEQLYQDVEYRDQLIQNFQALRIDHIYNTTAEIHASIAKLIEIVNAFKKENSIQQHLEDVSIAALDDQPLTLAESLLNKYLGKFRKTYSAEALKLIPPSCTFNGQILLLNTSKINELSDDSLLILGGSGRGKSLISKSIAIHSIDRDQVPIFVEAIGFSGLIQPLLENEAGLLAVEFKELGHACKKLQKKILLVVDGYNECPERLKKKLIRCVVAFAEEFSSRILITTQTQIQELQTLGLSTMEVLEPSLDVKKQIASSVGDKIDWSWQIHRRR